MIPVYEPWLSNRELHYVRDAVESSWVSSKGPYISRCEQLLATYVGTRHAVCLNSGTAACHLALASLNIGPSDEIIVPALTFVATANAVRYCGANVVAVDVSPDDWNLSLAAVAARMTNRTKAVFCVHLYGYPCDVVGLRAICIQKGIALIEDACEAFGSTIDGKQAGSFGDLACFSFFGNKTITAGEGGAVVTNCDEFAATCRCLSSQAQTSTYYHETVGYNYRITNIAAALLTAQLERSEEILTRKRAIQEHYRQAFAPYDSISLQKPYANGVCSNGWMTSILVPNKQTTMNHLKTMGIETRPVFYPLCDLPPYRWLEDAPSARKIHAHGVTLPSHPTLSTEDQDRVIAAVLSTI